MILSLDPLEMLILTTELEELRTKILDTNTKINVDAIPELYFEKKKDTYIYATIASMPAQLMKLNPFNGSSPELVNR